MTPKTDEELQRMLDATNSADDIGPHIDDETLATLVRDLSSEDVSDKIDRHLAACPDCDARFAALYPPEADNHPDDGAGEDRMGTPAVLSLIGKSPAKSLDDIARSTGMPTRIFEGAIAEVRPLLTTELRGLFAEAESAARKVSQGQYDEWKARPRPKGAAALRPESGEFDTRRAREFKAPLLGALRVAFGEDAWQSLLLVLFPPALEELPALRLIPSAVQPQRWLAEDAVDGTWSGWIKGDGFEYRHRKAASRYVLQLRTTETAHYGKWFSIRIGGAEVARRRWSQIAEGATLSDEIEIDLKGGAATLASLSIAILP